MVRKILSPVGVLAAFVLGGLGLRWLTRGTIEAVVTGPLTFDALLIALVSVLAWACFVWLALATLLIALSAIPGAVGAMCGAIADRITPAVYRRAARVALGIAVTAGPVLGGVLPAQAATTDHLSQTAVTSTMPNLDRPGTTLPAGFELPNLDRVGGDTADQVSVPERPLSSNPGLPTPDRPQTNDPVTRAPTREVNEVKEHVVQRGDTLWDIAKATLPDDASGAEITREWHRWYEANRQVIGEDPDLILPGQILKAPPGQPGSSV
jgi:hypothetical protein